MESLVSIAIIAMACATVYIACHLPRSVEEEHEEKVSNERRSSAYARQLREGVGSTFEFSLGDFSSAMGSWAGGVSTVAATVLDCDDDWVLVSFERSGKTVRAMIRYARIESLKELRL